MFKFLPVINIILCLMLLLLLILLLPISKGLILLIIITLLLPISKEMKFVLMILYIIYIHKIICLLLHISYPGIKLLIGDISMRKIFSYNMFNKNNFELIHNFHMLPQHNTIIVCNYPTSVMEYFVPHLLPKQVCLIAVSFGEIIIKLGYTPEEYFVFNKKNRNNYEKLKQKISQIIKTRSIFVYVEDIYTRFDDFHVGKMRKGMFYIAKELGITITPLAIDSIHISYFTIFHQKYQLYVGQTQKALNPTKSMRETRRFFIRQKANFSSNKYK